VLDPILVESTTDALVFLREFNHIITKDALQVHLSALHFTPRSSTIWNHFVELPNHPTFMKSGAEMYWPSIQMSLSSTTRWRTGVSFSPDGRFLAEVDDEAISQVSTIMVQIWDLESFSSIYMTKLPTHSHQIPQSKLAFSPDSETLLVSHLYTVHVLNFLQKYEPDTYTIPNNIERTTTAIAPDGLAFALGSPDDAIEIWRVKPYTELYKKLGHGCPLSLSSGGTSLLYSLQDLSASHSRTTLKCWHTDTAALVDILDSDSYDQSLSTDGMRTVLRSARCVSVHDSNTGTLLFQKDYYDQNDPTASILDATLSPDATHLAILIVGEEAITSSWVHVIEMKFGRLKAAYPGTGPLVWSPSSTILVFQDAECRIFLWERLTNQDDMVLTCSGHKDWMSPRFVISPDGHLLVPCHRDGEIPLLVLTSHTKSDTPQLRFSIDGPGFPNKNGETALLGIPLGPSPLDDTVNDISESRYLVTAFEISSNGRLIATLSDLGLITIYDASTGGEEGTFQTRLTNANHIQFASDGNFIAVTFKPTTRDFTRSSKSGSRQSEIWNTASRKTVYHSNVYQILQFYPTGHNLVCASFRKAQCVNTLDLETANVRGSEVPLSDDIIRIYTTLTFASKPNAHRLAGIDLDSGSVRVWDTERHLSIGQLEIPQCYEGAPLTELALSADGQTLAATSINCILIWVLESEAGLLSPTLVGHESFAHHPKPAHFPSFSPDSQVLAYTSNHRIKLWDVVKREFLFIEHSSIDHLWVHAREWHGDHHCCVALNPRILNFYRARDMTGFPEVVEHSERLRCTNADGFTGLFSQPGLEVYVPSYKLPISPILLRLNESQATVSWYWVQKDGRLVLLELPAP
jgi:WD40 repeat protein